MSELAATERERLVQLVTDALLHLPVKGKVLEMAARQVVLALCQDGALQAKEAGSE
jgi:hypothetical protein